MFKNTKCTYHQHRQGHDRPVLSTGETPHDKQNRHCLA